jgi:hypothetical protein
MHIANPIYDVVFKYMMEDKKVAKSFLSAIIGEEVLELDFSAQEYTYPTHIKKNVASQEDKKETGETPKQFLTVCRFDFSAKIAIPDGGYKTVLIELQKAKMASDIMRFRRYLGLHYQNENHTYPHAGEQKARQIYCIFLLGHDIDIPGRPVIQVDYNTKDVTTSEDVNATNEFIQSLHHRSWIVQIEQLKQRRRNDLEKLLSIFDQDNITQNHHILNVNEDDFPESYRPLIRRLHKAQESEKIQRGMEVEDDFLKELQDWERKNEEQRKVIEEKDKTIEEKDKTIEEKDKIIEEQRRAIEEQKRMNEEQRKAFEALKKQPEDIRKRQ